MLHLVFVRDIGLPPKMWMNQERMVVARRKLAGGECVKKVASDLGFLSAEAFRRRFLAVYRVSPGKYLSARMVFDPAKPLPDDWWLRVA
jgi:AraC-like DNA-binding protein